jgi:glycosyltransferase involved in cell wall biosynthesis
MLHVAVDGRLLAYVSGGITQYTRQLVSQIVPMFEPAERMTLIRSARGPRPTMDVPGLQYASVLTPPHNRFEQLTLPAELLRIRPSVVHSPDFIPPMRGPWRRVITVHDLAFLLYPETVTRASRAYYGQIDRAVRIADAIIAVSQHTADDIGRLLTVNPDRIRVIPNGVDPTLGPISDPALLEEWCAQHGIDRPYILFAGTFEPRKNLPLLVEAFARLRRQHDILLVLLGARGWLFEPTFERIESLDLADQVRILEGQPRSEWAVAYSGASVAVTPSLYEGFGLPVLEAMACGAPVVSSNASSLPEVVGDAGLLFQSDSVDALESALLSVLGDSALATRLQSAGFARAREFSWARAAQSTLSVYREVAA